MNKFNNFLILFIFILFLFLFGLVLKAPRINAVSCVNSCSASVSCGTPLCNNAGGCWFPNCAGNCGNGVCEPQSGEQCVNCPADCPASGDPICGGTKPLARCGDKICNGIETSFTCPVDCKDDSAGSGCNPTTVNCDGRKCGYYAGCGVYCYGPCQDSSKICDFITNKCLTPNTCTDTDSTTYRLISSSYFTKGTTTSKDSSTGKTTVIADECIVKSGYFYVKESFCDYLGNAKTNEYFCQNGCSNGACLQKTCEVNYKSQCGTKLDNGMGQKILDCSNNCAKESISTYCNPETFRCEKPCIETDGGKDPFLAGTVTNKNGGKSTDACFYSGDKVQEYFCNTNGLTISENMVCPNGCKNGACNACTPTKNCAKDYKGQCGKNLDDGCGNFLDCSNKCSGAKPYCDSNIKKCTKSKPTNCCISYFSIINDHSNICSNFTKSKDCISYTYISDVDGKKHPACSWVPVGFPAVKKCVSIDAFNQSEEMANSSPRCQQYLFLPYEAGSDTAVESSFFEKYNCSTKRYWLSYHGKKELCMPFFGQVSDCIDCDGINCTQYGFKNTACSIAQNGEEVLAGALTIKKKLCDKNDHITKVTVVANQAVSSDCTPTDMTLNITCDDIKIEYFSCDKLTQYNKDGSSCALATNIRQAQGEKVWCSVPNSKNEIKRAMCCPTDDSTDGWAWFYVDATNPKCASDPAFNKIFRNLVGALTEVRDFIVKIFLKK